MQFNVVNNKERLFHPAGQRHLLNALFATVESFTLCSGLQINYEKTEAMFLGNQDPKVAPAVPSIRNISIKKAVKILGVHFTYNQIL